MSTYSWIGPLIWMILSEFRMWNREAVGIAYTSQTEIIYRQRGGQREEVAHLHNVRTNVHHSSILVKLIKPKTFNMNGLMVCIEIENALYDHK